MIDGKDLFDESVNSSIKTYDSILKSATGQGDNYTTGCLLDYNYFNKHYKAILIDLRKQQALDADPKILLEIKFGQNVQHYFSLLQKQFFAKNYENIVNVVVRLSYCVYHNFVLL